MTKRYQTEAELMQGLDQLKSMGADAANEFLWDIGHHYLPAKEAMTPKALGRIVDEFVEPYPTRSMIALRAMVSAADQSSVMPVLDKLEAITTKPELSDDIRGNAALILRDSAVYKANLTPERITRLLDVVEHQGKQAGSQIIYLLSEAGPSKFPPASFSTPRTHIADLDPHVEQLARIAAKPNADGWRTGENVQNYLGHIIERVKPSPKPEKYQDPKTVVQYGELIESGKPWMEPDDFNRLSPGKGNVLVTVVKGFKELAMVTSERRGEYEGMFKAYAAGEYGTIQTYRVPTAKLQCS